MAKKGRKWLASTGPLLTVDHSYFSCFLLSRISLFLLFQNASKTWRLMLDVATELSKNNRIQTKKPAVVCVQAGLSNGGEF